MNTNLTGKLILITGASGGIGSAIVRAFAGEGAKLVLHYHRNLAGLRKLERELASVESRLVHADLTKEPQFENRGILHGYLWKRMAEKRKEVP